MTKLTAKDFKLEKYTIEPDMAKFPESVKQFYNKDTNIRTCWKFTCKKPAKGSQDEYDLGFARTQVIRNRCRLPMKYLAPDYDYNRYVCQKAPLKGASDDIASAAFVIEPLNPGFDDIIRSILIDQQLEVGDIFEINVEVPYSDVSRKFFRSKSLKQVGSKIKSKTPFDPNIHLGTLDIGSKFTAKYTVQQVDLKLFNSYQLFSYEIVDTASEFGFVIKTYQFAHIDAKYILDEVIKIAAPSAVPILTIWKSMC